MAIDRLGYMFLSCHVRVSKWIHTLSLPECQETLSDCNGTRTQCGFTLKGVRDMVRTYSQMHRTDKYSQHSSIIWPVWSNGWVFAYELNGCGF